MASRRPDYGQDAPTVRRGMFHVAGAGVLAILLGQVLPPAMRPVLAVPGWLAVLYGIGMGAYMTWGSRMGKFRTRDRLLDQAAAVRPWRGDEVALDVGCGRGLMLIGAAKRLPRGTAVGIDIWRASDQSGNGPDAIRENAALEGVADRVRIETGDARDLPFADSSFDLVLSHWVIHNIDEPADRDRSIDEIWRVLRPGGGVILADIGHVPAYADRLRSLGAEEILFFDGGWESRVMGALSGGTFRPQSLIALRPDTPGKRTETAGLSFRKAPGTGPAT